MEKRELINKLEKYLVQSNEQKLLTILIQNINKKNYIIYIYLSKKDVEAKYSEYVVKNNEVLLQKSKNIFFGRDKGTLLNMALEITCFDLMSGIPSNEDNLHESFSISLENGLHIISFGKKCEDDSYKYIYRFINYLLSYLKIEKKYFFEIPNNDEDSIIEQAINLDNEIILFMKKYESGRNYSFEKKLNEEWKKTDFNKRCNDICSKMNNMELIETIYKTEYVYDIGNCLEKLKPIEVDFDYLREFPDFLVGEFFKCVRFKNLILSVGFSDYYIEKILEKTKTDKTIEKLLKMMSNEQVMYLFNMVNDWSNKFEYMKYFEKEPNIEHKIQDYSFRNIDKKLVTVKSMTDDFDNFGIKELRNPFIGYVYIDPNSGLNIRVVGNEDNKNLIKKLCTKECILIRNDMFKYYDIELYDKDLDTYELEEQMKSYYDNNFVEMRKHKELDSLRNSLYPDDVKVLIPFKDKQEILWGRLLDYDAKNKFYIVSLLNNSYMDEELRVGTVIMCSLQKTEDNFLILVIKKAIISNKE